MQWTTLIPPVLAFAVVLWRKEVISALLVGVISAQVLLLMSTEQSIWLTPIASIEQIVSVFSGDSNVRILVFSLLVGALMALIRDSGGVAATVDRLLTMGVAKNKKQVGGVTMFTGIAIFIESNLSILTSGLLARGLFDKFNMSRARLAYIIDSTCAPICILILLNGWGAYVLGLISSYELSAPPIAILWGSALLNFYAIFTILLVLYTILTDKLHGPLADEEAKLVRNPVIETTATASRARFMFWPLATMILGMFGFMFWTGNGDLTQGSGSRSVLYATCLALVVCVVLLVRHRHMSQHTIMQTMFKGMGELLPLVSIVLLSIALGSSLRTLGTGAFVASIVGDFLPLFLIAPLLFIAGAIMSFTTGTSWGTFAILIPIGMPLAMSLGLPPTLVLSAILGGGVFGDHCSPISDTSAVAALASGCDLLTHVKTQLPYAMAAGGATIIAYIIASLLMLA
ncbi:MAG: Na+/H+ antiporter NhaC family protein [Glaciecola sp.]